MRRLAPYQHKPTVRYPSSGIARVWSYVNGQRREYFVRVTDSNDTVIAILSFSVRASRPAKRAPR